MDKTKCEDMKDFFIFNVEGVYTPTNFPSNLLLPSNELFPKESDEA